MPMASTLCLARGAGLGGHRAPARPGRRAASGARGRRAAPVVSAGRGRCRDRERAGARMVSLLVFGLWAENDCSPGKLVSMKPAPVAKARPRVAEAG